MVFLDFSWIIEILNWVSFWLGWYSNVFHCFMALRVIIQLLALQKVISARFFRVLTCLCNTSPCPRTCGKSSHRLLSPTLSPTTYTHTAAFQYILPYIPASVLIFVSFLSKTGSLVSTFLLWSGKMLSGRKPLRL